jgi:hypothetical protein
MLILSHGRHLGFEIKFSEAPRVTPSMHTALSDLQLDHLWVIYPGERAYAVHEKITAWPLSQLEALSGII